MNPFWIKSGRSNELRFSKQIKLDFWLYNSIPYSVRMRENADQNNSEYGHVLHSAINNFVLIISEFCRLFFYYTFYTTYYKLSK